MDRRRRCLRGPEAADSPGIGGRGECQGDRLKMNTYKYAHEYTAQKGAPRVCVRDPSNRKLYVHLALARGRIVPVTS